METMNNTAQDPLSDFFASEWKDSFSTEELRSSSGFSEAVLKKIVINRKQERLFYCGCIALALICVIAIMLFVYPGYEYIFSTDWSAGVSGVHEIFHTICSDIKTVFNETFIIPITQPENAFMLGLFCYLIILSGALLGLDHFLRKYRHTRTVSYS